MNQFRQTALALLLATFLTFSISETAEAAANPIAPTTAPSSIAVSTGTPPTAYLQAIKSLQENKYGENEMKSFVFQVFSLFDRHAEINQLLLLFAEDIDMVVPEGKIASHQDFEKWYKDIGARYQSNAYHVEKIDVQIPAKGDYRVELIVQWQALGVDGKYTSLRMRQQWKVVDGGGYWPRIVSYIAGPAM